MRTLVLVVSVLVVALVHVLTLMPQSDTRHWCSTEEIRTSHGGHHHKTMASFTDDTSDGDDGDDDDEVLASSVAVVIAPMTIRSHNETIFADDENLGPSTAHERLLERPPRA